MDRESSFQEKVAAFKARKLLAEVEQREIRTAILKGDCVELEQVRVEWTTQVGEAIALLRAKFESELPPVLSGLEAVGIQSECAAAIDDGCRMLNENEGSFANEARTIWATSSCSACPVRSEY